MSGSGRHEERGDLQELIVRMGVAMTLGGEAVHLIQDRLHRLGTAEGVKHLEIAVLPTTLLVEIGEASTARVQLGVRGEHAVPRLDQVSEIYSLADSIERNEVTPSDGLVGLDVILAARPSRGPITRIVGYGVLSIGFSLLLQPSWGGLVVAFVLGLLVGLLTTWRLATLRTLMPILASFLVATIVFLAADPLQAEPDPRTHPATCRRSSQVPLDDGNGRLAAGQVISGSSRLVQGMVDLGLMAFGIVAAAELVGSPAAHLLDRPFDRLGPWAPWIGLVILTLGQYLHNCAPRRTLLPILVVLIFAYAGQLAGAALFGADVSGFFGALAMTPVVFWMSETAWGPPSMVTFLPAFWLLVPGAAGFDRRDRDRRHRLTARCAGLHRRDRNGVHDRTRHPHRHGALQRDTRRRAQRDEPEVGLAPTLSGSFAISPNGSPRVALRATTVSFRQSAMTTMLSRCGRMSRVTYATVSHRRHASREHSKLEEL